MLSKADDYPIHQTPDPVAVSVGERNFYDRYFFDGFSNDGTVFFAMALGLYPQLDIMDAAFGVRIGDTQYNLHASRFLGAERMDIAVGPIRIEVIEPLRRLRIVVEEDGHGIEADLVFEARHAPIEEPRTTRRQGARPMLDITRMTQLGSYSGRIRAGGSEVGAAAGLRGARDRSWGIRPVGLRDPQPVVGAPVPQFHWYWVPAHFEDRVVHFFLNEDAEGRVWNAGLVMAHDDGRIEHLSRAAIEAPLIPGTRWPERAAITAEDAAGGAVRIELEPGARFYLSGIGYLNPDWGHGHNKGALAVGYDEIRTDRVVAHAPPHLHSQAFARATLFTPDGREIRGAGAFETLSFGPNAGRGLSGLYDAPGAG